MADFIGNKKSKIDEYLNKIRQGDSSALDPLYRESSKPLLSLCYTYLREIHDSEEALSETYILVVRNIHKYNGKNGFNWIYTIAKNVCLNMIRRKKKSVSVDFNDEETVNTLDLRSDAEIRVFDESGIISIAERVLNENEFRILVMHAVNDMKFKDVAKVVGGFEATVRWQYNNAIKKVKSAYERSSAV